MRHCIITAETPADISISSQEACSLGQRRGRVSHNGGSETSTARRHCRVASTQLLNRVAESFDLSGQLYISAARRTMAIGGPAYYIERSTW